MAPEERGKRRGDRSGILDQHPVVHTCNDDTLDIGQRRQKPPMGLAKARPERVAFPAEHSQDRLRDSLRLILVERPRSLTGDLLLEPCRGVHDGLGEGTWQHPIKSGAVVRSKPHFQEVVDHDFGALSSRAFLTLR